MHTSLALWSCVLMASKDVYFPGSSPILLIIQKSIYIFLSCSIWTYIFGRIILTTIKYLGRCLCPLCVCLKEKVRDLGTKVDDTRRSKIRVDSEMRQGMIETAREWIFKKGRSVTSKVIDRFLNFSMVPIRVGSSWNLWIYANVSMYRMPSQKLFVIMASIFIRCLLSISFMISSLVFGRVSSDI